MRRKEPCIILTFHTTADAIAFESYAKEYSLTGRLIPIPRELSAGCGMAWKAQKKEVNDLFFRYLSACTIPIEDTVEMDA